MPPSSPCPPRGKRLLSVLALAIVPPSSPEKAANPHPEQKIEKEEMHVGAQLTYERYIWFDQQIRQGRYPNAITLARKFEFSEKTARRAIDYMRTMLDAPLEYHPTRKGYYYADSAFSLPAFKVTQEELLAILVARNLLAGSAGGGISRAITRFGHKLFAMTGGVGLTEAFIDRPSPPSGTATAPARPRPFNAWSRPCSPAAPSPSATAPQRTTPSPAAPSTPTTSSTTWEAGCCSPGAPCAKGGAASSWPGWRR